MQLEGFEGKLGQVFERSDHLTGLRIGFERADELDVHPRARGDHEQAVLVAGFWFADKDRACERCAQGRAVDREGADLGVVGAVGRTLRAEVSLGVGAVALSVGGVGVDREAGRQGEDRGSEL